MTPAAGAPAPGSVLGGWPLERLLGRGAFGSVYLTRDPRTGAALALKTVPLPLPGADDTAQIRERFRREAAAAARLQHPDIVTVYASGEDHGVGFLVMERLSGADLTRYTRPARLLPEPLVLQIVARIADALGHAHAHGVVHRDVKPSNVVVDLPTHRVKVTDFGVARLDDAEPTRSGLVLGTPAYMAPEQLAGAPGDARGDLYALGVMLFQLLTGRLPFEGDSMGALLRAIANAPPLSLRELRPQLPQRLAEEVERALLRQPKGRHASAAEFAAALRAIDVPGDPAHHVTPAPPVAP